MSFTNYLEHKVLDHLFGGTTYTASGTLYVGLLTGSAPAESDSSFNEPPTASGYARVAVTNNKTNWSTASQVSTSGSLHNQTTITFPAATGPWGTVTYFGLFEGSGASANPLCLSALTTNKTIDTGDTASFASGSLVIRID